MEKAGGLGPPAFFVSCCDVTNHCGSARGALPQD